MKSETLEPGDVLLYRGRTLVGRFIGWWTRSEYCHAAMIGPDGDVLEMFDLCGGRSSTVAEQSDYEIDVFRLEPHIESLATGAASNMVEAIRERYSLGHAILAGLSFLFRPMRKECEKHGLHCSQAVSLS